MTAEEDALLRTLEARVTQVTLEYKALKDRYAALSRTMEEKDATIAALHSQIDRLQTDYANLKTAKMKRGLYHNPEIGAATSVHHHTAGRRGSLSGSRKADQPKIQQLRSPVSGSGQ